ncbi:unnamed protein product [Rhizoctonia solani]|uniref:Mid2 domain-containing protein n=1 Tax=Rhizoctonia solani TaxID=456999 RepID=A0A8H2WBR9_9AGAM|nr:unnamed protein product [Rhizoctonia solani]
MLRLSRCFVTPQASSQNVPGAQMPASAWRYVVGTIMPWFSINKVEQDPGCWCGNHNPVHYCAVCMANPTDNQTTPTQTEAATAGHNAFHIACNAYESYINSTDTMSPTSPVSPTASAAHDSPNESKVLVGPIVGGIVGGIVGLALVAGIIYLLSVRLKRNDHRHDVRPSSVSIFSSENKNSTVYASPYPQLPASYPVPVPGHISPRNRETMYVPELMEPITGPPQPRTPEISH